MTNDHRALRLSGHPAGLHEPISAGAVLSGRGIRPVVASLTQSQFPALRRIHRPTPEPDRIRRAAGRQTADTGGSSRSIGFSGSGSPTMPLDDTQVRASRSAGEFFPILLSDHVDVLAEETGGTAPVDDEACLATESFRTPAE